MTGWGRNFKGIWILWGRTQFWLTLGGTTFCTIVAKQPSQGKKLGRHPVVLSMHGKKWKEKVSGGGGEGGGGRVAPSSFSFPSSFSSFLFFRPRKDPTRISLLCRRYLSGIFKTKQLVQRITSNFTHACDMKQTRHSHPFVWDNLKKKTKLTSTVWQSKQVYKLMFY